MKKALNAVFGRAFVFALAASLTFCFVSCKESDDEEEETTPVASVPAELVGTWKSASGDTYVIGKSTFSNYMYDGADASYTINLVEVSELKETENLTYYLYYQSPESFPMVYGGVSYGNYYTKNYYTAVRVIVKSDSVLDICCACNAEFKSEDADFETVKNTFTIGNGFFGSKIEYTKQ